MLVDSEVISCRAHAETLTRHGYPITPDQVLERFLGVSDREARLIIEAELGRRLPDDFEAAGEAGHAAIAMRTICSAIPYVGEAIAAIDLPKCVASSGTPEKIRHGLDLRRALRSCSRRIFSPPAQVKRGKPAPDLFLFAAGQMQVPPAAMPGDRGQRARRHRRARRRDDRARLSWRQPLPARLWRHAARGGRGHDF